MVTVQPTWCSVNVSTHFCERVERAHARFPCPDRKSIMRFTARTYLAPEAIRVVLGVDLGGSGVR